MKNKKIIILLVLILCLVGVTSGLIVAWLTDTKTTSSTTWQVGDVEYSWDETGALTGTVPVVPGQELIGSAFKLTNSSTVASEIRVEIKIEYTLADESNGDGLMLFLENPDFIGTLDEGKGWLLDSGWTYDADDKKYYYGTKLVPTIVDFTTLSIPVLSSLTFDGSKVGNSYSNSNFIITFVFEAKQKEYVVWSDLGTVNFETGLSN
jgi:hypothetical protein